MEINSFHLYTAAPHGLGLDSNHVSYEMQGGTGRGVSSPEKMEGEVEEKIKRTIKWKIKWKLIDGDGDARCEMGISIVKEREKMKRKEMKRKEMKRKEVKRN